MTTLGAFMGFLLLSGGITAGLPAHASAPTVPAIPSYAVTLTAYNAVPGQTDDTPFETASGAYSNPEVVAARSRDLAKTMPFGTIVEIDSSTIPANGTCGYDVVSNKVGYRVIADSMNPRYEKRIDILLDDSAHYATVDRGMKNAAEILGICSGATVRVVGYVDIRNIPKTQEELARIVTGENGDLALR